MDDTKKEDRYLYKDSGIVEGRAKVPRWLFFVFVGLFIWGIYYLVKF
ncbi:MAG: cbb3-type cytochrome c oxidase N-terminal domain-containing protein [Candidatus Scalinduaceae bacterium]